MIMKVLLRLAAVFLCLIAVRTEAREFAYDFSGVDDAVTPVSSFAIGDIVHITGPSAVSFALEIVSAPPAGIAGQSFIAKDTATGIGAVVKPKSGNLLAAVDDFIGNKMYFFRIQDGVKTFSVREKTIEPDECATCASVDATPVVPTASPAAESPTLRSVRTSAPLRSAGSEFPPSEQKAVVDILVVFDQGAKAKCEPLGFEGMDEFADYAVNKMNMVLANSQLNHLFSYRLVGVVEIDGAWREVNGALLGSLRTREGCFSRLSQLRKKCGADTITLLIDRTEGSTAGIAYGYYLSGGYDVPSKFDNQNYACNVCDINTVYNRYTMSHETGHNMGCGHSNRQGGNSGPGRYPDSCGYHFTDANGVRRSTVMAYTYASGDSYYYEPVPYFSTPGISPAEYGCALGEEGVNNNRGTLTLTYADIAGLREHVVPYDWDVRFLDDSGKDIPDGSYFYSSCYVTLTNENPEAEIYYTLDGSCPTSESLHGGSGTKVYMYLVSGSKTLTACAVVDGMSQSVRSITLHDGLTWSGDSSGNGLWLNADSSVCPWNGEYFYNGDAVMFPDLAGVSCATVTVNGVVAPGAAAFPAIETAYTFDKGEDAAKIAVSDASFLPSGDLTFNVPVQMSATSFTTPTGSAIAFNAPFGQVLEPSSGYCTNSIVVGNSGTLIVAPGDGKTQRFDAFNNTGSYYNTATLQIGEGTIVFNGAINGGKGLFGSTKITVGDGGNLVFNVGGATGYDVGNSSLTVEKGGTVTFAKMEHMRRSLYLNGGVVNCATRFDLLGNPGVYVTDDSSMENAGSGYVLVRNSDAVIDVSADKTLTMNVGTQTDGRNDTNGKGLIKTGCGELVANRVLSHTGATIVSNGTLSVGYSSSVRVGLGWTVASGATLKLKAGASLAVTALAVESGATLALPATNAAPLSATNEVNLSGVRLALDGASDLALGKTYSVLSSTGGFAGVSGVVTDGLPALAEGLEWEVAVSNGSLVASVVTASVLNIPLGETYRLEDVDSRVVATTGEGTLLCGAALPAASYGFTNSAWRGTVAFEDLDYETATQNFRFELYGNAGSKIKLTNCKIQYLMNNNGIFAGTLILDGDNAFCTRDGYSSNYNVFGALEGSGAMAFTGKPKQGYVFNVATNFSGSINVDAASNGSVMEGRRIVFGEVATLANLPSQAATITLKSGTSASIGTNATWMAYHGIEIAGTLIVKGAGATLDCNANAAMGLKFANGSTLRFDTADAKLTFGKTPQLAAGAMNFVSFSSGVSPYAGKVLAIWPEGGAPAGEFALADAALAEDWTLSKTETGLVMKRAPLPANVPTSITVRRWGDDGWEDTKMNFMLPTGWVTNYYPSLDSLAAVAAKYNETATNGATVWQCYMLGLDPTSAESVVSLSMRVEGDKLRFVVDGLGDTHALDGIKVYWYMKTSTNLVSDAGFSGTRDSATGLSPFFADHPMPDKPTASATKTADSIFYKVTATFVAEDDDVD